ncbi:hypothetical protein GGR21_000391 [Dysgonomonas hofstadii]|uniref:Exo-beta-D-glucosaminidase Ig-fold domain-containing protein n=1 Tax=Dysgonomonas hofstadii TaxID=637886 RepID=A0A840CGY7_9BACT|nr:hypothetical protein [Dysgonomonas hofstadii]MBB4034506.1 hypothetical protein [Dysgonomonas hofstadii]
MYIIYKLKTEERILPAFYEDYYIPVVPGETKAITMEYTPQAEAPLKLRLRAGIQVNK